MELAEKVLEKSKKERERRRAESCQSLSLLQEEQLRECSKREGVVMAESVETLGKLSSWE